MSDCRVIRALVFDFDGTLARLTIDFELMKRRIASLAAVFLPHRPQPNSVPALEWLEELAARVAETDKGLAREFHCRARLAITAMELDAAREAELFVGTRPMLEGLARRGLACAVITRNSTAAVKVVFPDIHEHCRAFIAREDAPRVKPHPEHLLSALDRLAVDPGRALMVGDHPMDIETAKRAGTLSAGVASGRVGESALLEAGADFVAPDCAGLVQMLDSQGLLPDPNQGAGQ